MSHSEKIASPDHRQAVKSLLGDTLIAVPVLNEEGNIAPTVNAIKMISPESPILFVEGNSNDASLQEIHKSVAMYDNVNVIQT
jgi:glycosyltransferase involved in cell wall biosynthesis